MGECVDLAVAVRGAVKGYGSQLVLKGLDMDVPYGSIYGLLGSSGCGKTTLLRCILGQFSLEDGIIEVLGKPPGAAGHQVPGRDVGYMPQEMALYGDFTMSETMYYFGILHGMKLKDIQTRRTFLTDFLELPTQNKLIRTLSGGQKRRFSFAVAMLQQPPLMILDEPTVGVDPILRAKIWEHLVELVSTTRTTIVITTHYIEEARQANLVGMMREGRLLAEQPPAALISSYRMNTLEDVFLQLCRIQDSEKYDQMECTSPINSSPTRSINMEVDEETPLIWSEKTDVMPPVSTRGRIAMADANEPSYRHRINRMATNLRTSLKCTRHPVSLFPRPLNILALSWKNLVHIYRNPGLLLFQFLVPVFQICIFALAIGGNLKDIRVTYVNEDVGAHFLNHNISLSSVCNNTDMDGGLVNYSNLGQLYVDQLKYHTDLVVTHSSSFEAGLKEVKHGDAWSVIYIGSDFTMDLFKRLCSTSLCPPEFRQQSTNETINGSTIHIRSDVTNLQVSVTIQNQTTVAYELFSKDLIQSCSNLFSITSSMLSPPIQEDEPVYGRTDLSFTDYMAPGMIASIAFGISIGLCAMALIVERNEGMIDRTWVAGVNAAEVVISQVFTQFFILAIQITLLLLVAIFGFKIYMAYLPDFWVIGALTMLQGLTGMAFGLFLSSVCGTETAAIQSAIAVYYPTLLLSGVFWPLEGMPTWLRYISYCLPCTLPAEAMRGTMERGWGFEHEIVWRGLLVTIGWFIAFLFLAGATFNMRK